ncbi:MAG: copper-binding protein [Proteobacteria bacterium]|nr:copper-binding protein [Pseudomonadota bacterium]
MSQSLGRASLVVGAALACGVAFADVEKKPDAPSAAQAVVYTRAVVRSFFEEDGRLYVRLRLLPTTKIPFTTQNFLVADRTLLDGIGEGASVRFTARHMAGESTLTSIEVADPCKRFRKCE